MTAESPTSPARLAYFRELARRWRVVHAPSDDGKVAFFKSLAAKARDLPSAPAKP